MNNQNQPGAATTRRVRKQIPSVPHSSNNLPVPEPEACDQYLELFNTLPDVLIQTDLHGLIRIVNPACKDFFGYEPGEMIGRVTKEFYLRPEEREDMLAQ